MICVQLEGGLGNQLFQYAAGRALASRHNAELVLYTSTLAFNSAKITPREMELNRFQINARVSKPGEMKNNFLFRRFPYISSWLTQWVPYVEDSVLFDSNFHSLPDQTYLIGYWQSFRFFSEISKLIYSELEPIEALSTQSKHLVSEIEACNSVAIHVRRGDYVSLKSASAMHGTLSLTYYQQAINDICNAVAVPKFFVFSDDPCWCAENLPLPPESSIYVKHNSGGDSWQDLILMGRCRNHIIANSSFSWWGAWLADQRYGENRVVVAPGRWFREGSNDTQDRFPAHWYVQS